MSYLDKEGNRLWTVRFSRMPEGKKRTLKAQLEAEFICAMAQQPRLRMANLADGAPDNWHYPLECLAEDLTDVRVTGCLFAAAPGIQEIYCAVITDGHRFTVDHCVSLGCHACAVFWDGGRGVEGRGNAMHHCIVDGARIAGVWTCDTGEDFEFHHNVVARSEYFWMRKRGATRTYAVRDCLLVGNRNRSGYGVERGPTAPIRCYLRGDEHIPIPASPRHHRIECTSTPSPSLPMLS